MTSGQEPERKFLQGLLKLPIHKIDGKDYILIDDIGNLSDSTFGKALTKSMTYNELIEKNFPKDKAKI